MYGINKGADLSSSFLDLGGLAHIRSHPGGSKTSFALSCLGAFFDPLSPSLESATAVEAYYLFIADEGFLYPGVLAYQWKIPLSRLVLAKVPDPNEVWRVGLEAIQTGLFSWVFLRPSRACPANHLRKLQLSAERTQSRVFLLSNLKLPHWMFKINLAVEGNFGPGGQSALQRIENAPTRAGAAHETIPLFSKSLSSFLTQ
jgi:hypothetical protein